MNEKHFLRFVWAFLLIVPLTVSLASVTKEKKREHGAVRPVVAEERLDSNQCPVNGR